MIRMRAYNTFPPGGWSYTQVGPVPQLFPDIGLNIFQQAELVLKFRKANGLANADFASVVQDISVFTCTRLKGDPRFCEDSESPITVIHGGGGCSSCGGAANHA